MTNAYWDPVYFGETGGNVVSIEDLYTGGKNTVTGLDAEYLKLLEEYTVGQECTEEDCEKCQFPPYRRVQEYPLCPVLRIFLPSYRQYRQSL